MDLCYAIYGQRYRTLGSRISRRFHNSWIIEWLLELGFSTIALLFNNSFEEMLKFMNTAADGAAYADTIACHPMKRPPTANENE
jgi:hypothetical protein